MTEDQKPTLLDPEAVGGDTAEGGFGYQTQAILARVPVWLSCDGFTDMMREGYADAEGRFFVPGIGMAREFIEYKNHSMSPSEFWAEIERFWKMETAFPGGYWRFTLVCTGVSEAVSPMLNALRRVRNALPFYSDAPPMTEASYRAFVEKVQGQKRDELMARFLFDKVHVETDPPRNIELGFGAFRTALEQEFPAFQDSSKGQALAAYQALSTAIGPRATPIRRAELETALWSGVTDRVQTQSALHLVTTSEPPAGGWDLPKAVVFVWSQFSGTDRRFPAPAEWERVVVSQLRDIRAWVEQTGRTRRILLSGRRRLSASLAIGSVFNAVSGFAVDVQIGEELWATDDHATTTTPTYDWHVDPAPTSPVTDIAVAIGVGREPAAEVSAYLASLGETMPLLSLSCSEALRTAQHTNVAVRGAKAAIADAVTATGAKTLHLFIAGPAQFAVFLGHRLNTTGAVQCYERTGPSQYQATCLLPNS